MIFSFAFCIKTHMPSLSFRHDLRVGIFLLALSFEYRMPQIPCCMTCANCPAQFPTSEFSFSFRFLIYMKTFHFNFISLNNMGDWISRPSNFLLFLFFFFFVFFCEDYCTRTPLSKLFRILLPKMNGKR